MSVAMCQALLVLKETFLKLMFKFQPLQMGQELTLGPCEKRTA